MAYPDQRESSDVQDENKMSSSNQELSSSPPPEVQAPSKALSENEIELSSSDIEENNNNSSNGLSSESEIHEERETYKADLPDPAPFRPNLSQGAKLAIIHFHGEEESEPIMEAMIGISSGLCKILCKDRPRIDQYLQTRPPLADIPQDARIALPNGRTLLPNDFPGERKVSVIHFADRLMRGLQEEGLAWNINVEFSAHAVPISPSYSSNQNVEKMFGIIKPRPEYTFGLSPRLFTNDEMAAIEDYSSISKTSAGLIGPFLVMIEKRQNCNLSTCFAEARQIGAAMVAARRNFRATMISKASGVYEYTRVDLGTFAFTLIINGATDRAFLLVHWCRRVQGIDHWYMCLMKKHRNLNRDDEVGLLNTSLHRIGAWWLVEHQPVIKADIRRMRRTARESGDDDTEMLL